MYFVWIKGPRSLPEPEKWGINYTTETTHAHSKSSKADLQARIIAMHELKPEEESMTLQQLAIKYQLA